MTKDRMVTTSVQFTQTQISIIDKITNSEKLSIAELSRRALNLLIKLNYPEYKQLLNEEE